MAMHMNARAVKAHASGELRGGGDGGGGGAAETLALLLLAHGLRLLAHELRHVERDPVSLVLVRVFDLLLRHLHRLVLQADAHWRHLHVSTL